MDGAVRGNEKAITGANTIATTDVRAYADDENQSMAARMAANSVAVTEVPPVAGSDRAEQLAERLRKTIRHGRGY